MKENHVTRRSTRSESIKREQRETKNQEQRNNEGTEMIMQSTRKRKINKGNKKTESNEKQNRRKTKVKRNRMKKKF